MDTPDGEFLPLPTPDPPVVEELFRRLVLLRVHQAERLSEIFADFLLSQVHSYNVFSEVGSIYISNVLESALACR